jgi:hypothetical protein
MSEQQPPTGDSSYGDRAPSGAMPDYGRNDVPLPPADTVTLGGGAWNDPKGDGRGRTWWYAGGAAVAAIALIAGGTVFAATQLRAGHDAGSAAALPSGTLLYAGIDLNPNAGQKIEAIKALRHFPAFARGVKVDPDADLRKLFVEDELTSDGCSLDWGSDVAPWLGNDIGAALVPGPDAAPPQPVGVLAVKDEAAAKKNLPRLLDCAELPHGLSIADGWAVIAPNDTVAKGVAVSARRGSLSDDDDFKTWVDRTGDPGVATYYASKDAGATLAGSASQALGMIESVESSGSAAAGAVPPGADGSSGGRQFSYAQGAPAASDSGACPRPAGPSAGPSGTDMPYASQLEKLKKELARFRGGAATLRFAGSGFEIESASGSSGATPSGGTAGVATLPADTAIAFGSTGGAYGSSWVDGFTTGFALGFAQECGSTPAKVLGDLTRLTGLTLPDDLHTLAGQGLTFAASGSIDPEVLANSTTPSDLAVGLKLQGDPEQIAGVLQKISLPGAQQVLGTTTGDGVVAVGPDPGYRAELVKGGGLGTNGTFTDVVPHADKAISAFYVSFDGMRKLLASNALGVPADVRDNLDHLRAFGASSWVDGGVTHGLVRLSTR